MEIKNQSLYQGRDWFSESRTIAMAYDALDMIHDLCLYQTKGQPPSLFKEQHSLLPLLTVHMDILYKNLLQMTGELIPGNQHNHGFRQGWLIFEIQQLEKELRALVSEVVENNTDKHMREIMALTHNLKEHIRKCDLF